jgi:acetylornithine/N-succinyldiaminopimelate aminotransferase
MKLHTSTKTTNAQWMERWKQSSMGNYAPASVAFERGQGSRLWDVEGKEYLDFAAGVAVCSTGHAHPTIAQAIAEQSAQLLHTSNLYLVPNQIRLAEELLALSGLHRAFFCNSGTEALEASLKIARYWGAKNGRTDLITTHHAFHGRTMGALALTQNPKYHHGFEPLLPGVRAVDYDNLEAVKHAITNKTCAVVVEPIQGEGGVNVPRDGYLRGLRDLCDDKGILLILDEVQTGIGRTGEWFAYLKDQIKPDLLALAKGLGSGFPIGAVLCSERANVLQPGAHGSTFGGNPLACAAGLATLRVIREENVLPNVRRQGAHLLNHLSLLADKNDAIANVRGAGLLVGFDLKEGTSKEFASRLLTRGLLVSNIGDKTIRLAPPLTVSAAEIEDAFDHLQAALAGPS